MSPTPDSPAIIRFGVFEAHPATGELWKSGARVRIQEQPFRVLAMLLGRPGTMVTREELQTALWPDVAYGEFEQGLNTAIKKVRQALGDTADNPRFVETLPRKGYRFIAPVHPAGSAEAPAPAASVPAAAPARRAIWPAALGVVAVLGGAAAWFFRPDAELAPRFTTAAPLTTMRGFESAPSFSPDAQQIAFAWNGDADGANYDIYVKRLGSENVTRLTRDPRRDSGPSWSPDGGRIAFVRSLREGRSGIFLAAVSGAAEAKLAEAVELDWLAHHPLLDWSPDGKWLAFTDFAAEDVGKAGARPCIQLLSVETGERRRLTAASEGVRGDVAPAFSPDGHYLAFIRAVAVAWNELYVLPLTREWKAAGPPVQVDTGSDGRVASVSWMPDGRLAVAKPWRWGAAENSGLWLIGREPGRPRPVRIDTALDTSATVSVSRKGDIAYSVNRSDKNIWRVELDGERRPAGAPQPFIASTMDDLVPKYSPDGGHIVFVSMRGGSEEVWISRSDGSDPLQLTHMGYAGSPSWSPDGSRIVFDSMKEEQYEVYSMPATGGAPRRLTNHPAMEGVATYSADGQSIFFVSNRGGSDQIWRIRADGGEPTQITRNGGYLARPSADGKFLYYYYAGDLRRVPVNGGEEVKLPTPKIAGFLNFTVTRDSIYYFPVPAAGEDVWIERFDLEAGTRRRVVSTSPGGKSGLAVLHGTHFPFSRAGLTVSPDGRSLLWAQADQAGSDILHTRLRTSGK